MRDKVLKVFIFIFIVVLVDKGVAFICEKLYYRSNDRSIYRLRYTLDSTKEDILIFGSSRAQHHFIPGIINATTGLSSYNCGFGGEGLLFSLIQLNETLRRYKPKVIVLEVSPNILIDPDSEKKLKILMPYSKRDLLIYNAVINNEVFERVKLLSSIYPYNSTIGSLITGLYKPNSDTLNGFEPLTGIIDTSRLTSNLNTAFSSATIPLERINTFKRFITLCNNNNLKLIIVVSPVFQSNKKLDEMVAQIETYCSQFKNLNFLDYSKCSEIYQDNIYFKDNLHLNFQGASVFSKIFSKKLNEIIK